MLSESSTIDSNTCVQWYTRSLAHTHTHRRALIQESERKREESRTYERTHSRKTLLWENLFSRLYSRFYFSYDCCCCCCYFCIALAFSTFLVIRFGHFLDCSFIRRRLAIHWHGSNIAKRTERWRKEKQKKANLWISVSYEALSISPFIPVYIRVPVSFHHFLPFRLFVCRVHENAKALDRMEFCSRFSSKANVLR